MLPAGLSSFDCSFYSYQIALQRWNVDCQCFFFSIYWSISYEEVWIISFYRFIIIFCITIILKEIINTQWNEELQWLSEDSVPNSFINCDQLHSISLISIPSFFALLVFILQHYNCWYQLTRFSSYLRCNHSFYLLDTESTTDPGGCVGDYDVHQYFGGLNSSTG